MPWPWRRVGRYVETVEWAIAAECVVCGLCWAAGSASGPGVADGAVESAATGAGGSDDTAPQAEFTMDMVSTIGYSLLLKVILRLLKVA